MSSALSQVGGTLKRVKKKPGADFQKVLEAFLQVEEPYLHAVRPEAGRWEYAGGILGVRSSVAWVIWDAQHFGVPQRRRRVFLVADFAGYSAIPILAIPDSVPGYVRIDYTNKQKQQKFTVFEIVVSPYNLVVISQFDEVGNQINFSTY